MAARKAPRSGRNLEQKPARVSRAPRPGTGKAPGKGPVSARGTVAADRTASRAMQPTPQGEGGPIPPRGQKSGPAVTLGPRAVRDYAPKGNGTTIGSRANAAGRRKGVSG